MNNSELVLHPFGCNAGRRDPKTSRARRARRRHLGRELRCDRPRPERYPATRPRRIPVPARGSAARVLRAEAGCAVAGHRRHRAVHERRAVRPAVHGHASRPACRARSRRAAMPDDLHPDHRRARAARATDPRATRGSRRRRDRARHRRAGAVRGRARARRGRAHAHLRGGRSQLGGRQRDLPIGVGRERLRHRRVVGAVRSPSCARDEPGARRPCGRRRCVRDIGWQTITSVAYTAALASLVGYTIWNMLLGRYPAAMVAPFALLAPPVGLAAAALVLGEVPNALELAGSALLVGGVAVGQLRRRSRDRANGGARSEPIPVLRG